MAGLPSLRKSVHKKLLDNWSKVEFLLFGIIISFIESLLLIETVIWWLSVDKVYGKFAALTINKLKNNHKKLTINIFIKLLMYLNLQNKILN